MNKGNFRAERDINFSEPRRKWISNLPANTQQYLEDDAACFFHHALSTPYMKLQLKFIPFLVLYELLQIYIMISKRYSFFP